MSGKDSVSFAGLGVRILRVSDGEQVFQLTENGRYEYEVLGGGWRLEEKSGVIRRSHLRGDTDRGYIEPGNYVGLLKLTLKNGNPAKAKIAHIDVRSQKLNYDTDYRAMLEDIADRCADFLLQLDSPVEQRLLPDDDNEATLAQRLYFLRGLLGGVEFQQALQRIVTMPNTRWRGEVRNTDIRRARRLGGFEIRQFATASRRVDLPLDHPLRARVDTVPERIDVRDKRDTVDTPENRFVKHALSLFSNTLESLQDRFDAMKKDRYPGLRKEIRHVAEKLDEVMGHEMFKKVSRLQALPLNSPILQNKEGYRQVLRAWMLFELAARLTWEGGDDVYEGGKRDVAALYEYWVFFRMLDLVSNLFELDQPAVADLLSAKDLVLKLKAGKHLPLTGTCSKAGRELRVQFSYNREFDFNPYPESGSWTRKMRPDYTISLWPAEFSSDEAEEQELITHIHFDAKYRIGDLSKLFAEEVDLDEEKKQQRAGNYKRADLLKMHAYRDSIRRSAGAYVLYPGTETDQKQFKGFHELLPGLGAFALRPGGAEDGANSLERFLKEVVSHACNRASQREQQSYHTYRVHKDMPPPELRAIVPESVDGYRVRPTQETYVIPAWSKDAGHKDWCEKEGLYNFRAGMARGSLRLNETITGASYLLLRGKGQHNGGGTLYQITSNGPRVLAKDSLEKMGYPEPSGEFYLVFDIALLKPDDPLLNFEWDLGRLPQIPIGRQAGVPGKGIPLHEFMKAAVSSR